MGWNRHGIGQMIISFFLYTKLWVLTLPENSSAWYWSDGVLWPTILKMSRLTIISWYIQTFRAWIDLMSFSPTWNSCAPKRTPVAICARWEAAQAAPEEENISRHCCAGTFLMQKIGKNLSSCAVEPREDLVATGKWAGTSGENHTPQPHTILLAQLLGTIYLSTHPSTCPSIHLLIYIYLVYRYLYTHTGVSVYAYTNRHLYKTI